MSRVAEAMTLKRDNGRTISSADSYRKTYYKENEYNLASARKTPTFWKWKYTDQAARVGGTPIVIGMFINGVSYITAILLQNNNGLLHKEIYAYLIRSASK